MRTTLAPLVVAAVLATGTLAGCTLNAPSNDANVNVAAPSVPNEAAEDREPASGDGALSAASASESADSWADGIEVSEDGSGEVVEGSEPDADGSGSSEPGSGGSEDPGDYEDNYPVDVGDSTAPYTNEPFPIQ